MYVRRLSRPIRADCVEKDPAQAAQELERAVKMLGFFGGLVNDYQSVCLSCSS